MRRRPKLAPMGLASMDLRTELAWAGVRVTRRRSCLVGTGAEVVGLVLELTLAPTAFMRNMRSSKRLSASFASRVMKLAPACTKLARERAGFMSACLDPATGDTKSATGGATFMGVVARGHARHTNDVYERLDSARHGASSKRPRTGVARSSVARATE